MGNISYPNTNPTPGDLEVTLLGKILQRFGGLPGAADTPQVLLANILSQLNAADGDGGGGVGPAGPAGATGPAGADGISFLPIAVGDELLSATVGTSKVAFHAGVAFTISSAIGSLSKTAPTGASFIMDLNKNGTSILSAPITIVAGAQIDNAAHSIVTTSFSVGDLFSVDIDQIGSATAGTAPKIWLNFA